MFGSLQPNKRKLTSLETYAKSNNFFWSENECVHYNLNHLGGGVEGFRLEKLHPQGVPSGIGCPGVGGAVSAVSL